jgi:hypothetical protein
MTYPQYAPQAAPQAMPAPAAPQFIDPSGGGMMAPLARHLVGRTLVIEPIRVDDNAKYQGQAKPVAYANILVVDGGPIEYGDSQDRNLAHNDPKRRPTHRVNTPCYFRNAMVPNEQLVNSVRGALGMGALLGVIQQGTQGQQPYLLTKVERDVLGNERPDAAQRRQLAADTYARLQAGDPLNQPVLLTPAAVPPQPAPTAGPQFYGPTNAQAGYAPTVYAPQGAAAFGYGQPGYVQNYAAPQSAPPVPAPLAAHDTSMPAPGWDASMWTQMTPDQRAQIWAQYAPQLQVQSQPQGGVPISAVPATQPTTGVPAHPGI